jgi:hypothetical protein
VRRSIQLFEQVQQLYRIGVAGIYLRELQGSFKAPVVITINDGLAQHADVVSSFDVSVHQVRAERTSVLDDQPSEKGRGGEGAWGGENLVGVSAS